MIAVLLASVVLWCAVSAAYARTYANRDYGFRVDLPIGKAVCQTPPPAPNHGLVVLLNTSDCDGLVAATRMEVYVHHNVVSFSQTTAALAEEVCHGAPSWPTRMKLGTLPLRRCDMRAEAGDLPRETYFALRPPPRDRSDFGVVFAISLYCQTKDCAMYEKDLRTLLSGIKVALPW
jgi:hypothetical protein